MERNYSIKLLSRDKEEYEYLEKSSEIFSKATKISLKDNGFQELIFEKDIGKNKTIISPALSKIETLSLTENNPLKVSFPFPKRVKLTLGEYDFVIVQDREKYWMKEAKN
ncbi:MAG: hypothetical protein KC516_03585 [Nanoarchaeota archaeon]|nr:hypothetical protein [Nanoarchaeota archaeon]